MPIQTPPAELLETIVNRVNVGVFVVDANRNIQIWNRWMEFQTGKRPEEACGQNLFDCFPDLPKKWLEKKFQTIFLLKSFVFVSWQQRPYIFPLKDQHSIAAAGGDNFMRQDCTFIPLLGKSGAVEGICITIHDVTDISVYQSMLKEANIGLKEIAIRDPLTGSYNRRHLEHTLSVELERFHRYGGRLSVIVSDIDFFKKINDTYGHIAGDHVLKATAKKLMDITRSSDTVCRYGGEEFAIILPGISAADALAAAERFRQAIEGQTIVFDHKTIPVTTSLGVAEARENHRTNADLISTADESLYYSKHNGRNRATCLQLMGERAPSTSLTPAQGPSNTATPESREMRVGDPTAQSAAAVEPIVSAVAVAVRDSVPASARPRPNR